MSAQPASFDPAFTACPMCQAKDIAFLLQDYLGVDIWECGSCQTRFMNPQYTAAHLADYYSQYELGMGEGGIGAAKDEGWEEALRECHNFYISLLEKHTSKGKFMSIGSGTGLELEIARDRGWQAEGFDVDPGLVEKMVQRTGIPARSGDWLALDYEPESYQAIYMHHVLEHPKDPRAYLEKIYGLLKPGGILFIACPNILSLANRFKSTMEKLGLKKSRVGRYYDSYHHLFYYSPWRLRRFLTSEMDWQVPLVRNGYHVRPFQSSFKRSLMKNVLELYPYKSTFLLLAQKPKG